jgi:predicted phosphodiesterase
VHNIATHCISTRLSNGIDVVISGHSHKPPRTRFAAVYSILNPGSAGPRRLQASYFAVAQLLVDGGGRVTARIHRALIAPGPLRRCAARCILLAN